MATCHSGTLLAILYEDGSVIDTTDDVTEAENAFHLEIPLLDTLDENLQKVLAVLHLYFLAGNQDPQGLETV